MFNMRRRSSTSARPICPRKSLCNHWRWNPSDSAEVIITVVNCQRRLQRKLYIEGVQIREERGEKKKGERNVRKERWMGPSQWEKYRASKEETTVPLPAAKVAETRLLRGISIPHHDRKSLPQTEPIKIRAWIKISKACQMASPHHRGLSAVDASREGMKSA